MRAWVPATETSIYLSLARFASRHLGKLAPVRSIYTRRSLACGEVVFGSSDIDLHVIIDPLPNLRAEAMFLNELADRFAALKRFVPCLGDCDVSTCTELQSWYTSRPYTWYRDRAWLRLFGEEYQRPTRISGARDDSLLWWFFWAWERLPDFCRAGRIRTCCNLFVDMLNAYGVYVGTFHAPMRREEVLDHWRSTAPSSQRRHAIWRAFRNGFRGAYRTLQRSIYIESLELCEALAAQTVPRLEGVVRATELPCHVPFSFSARTYLLVDPAHPEQVHRALDAMQGDAAVFVTTPQALTLYLYHRNPWEYFALQSRNPSLALSPPPPPVLNRALSLGLNRERPRAAGFSVGRRTGRSAAVGCRYAQYRLYVDEGAVATSATDLHRRYTARYDTWPYSGIDSRAVYFERDYGVICETIDEISRRVGAAPV